MKSIHLILLLIACGLGVWSALDYLTIYSCDWATYKDKETCNKYCSSHYQVSTYVSCQPYGDGNNTLAVSCLTKYGEESSVILIIR